MKEVDISPEVLLSILIDVRLVSNFSRNVLIDIVELCKVYSYEPGERIIDEGAEAFALYTVVSGSVDVLKEDPSKGSVKLNTLRVGAIFGESSLFLMEPATATVVANEETMVMALPGKTLSDYITAHPKSGLVLLSYIVLDLLRKIDSCNEQIVSEKAQSVSPADLEAIRTLLPFTMEDIVSE